MAVNKETDGFPYVSLVLIASTLLHVQGGRQVISRLSDPEACRGPGRPQQLDAAERETLILDAAERVIIRNGLEAASMSAIAVEAGMSKRTLYGVFDSRAELFAAIVRRIRSSVTHTLDASEHRLPLEQRLRLLLLPSIDKEPNSAPAAILRAVVAEAERQPELAEEFLEEGPRALRKLIREELELAVTNGEIRIADTTMAADLLAGMVFGDPLTHLVDPNAGQIPPKERKRRLDKAIDVFLHGIGG